MTDLGAANVASLVGQVNAANTEGLRKFLPAHAEWKRNKPLYEAAHQPVPPEPLGPPIGTVDEAKAGAIHDAWYEEVKKRFGQAMPKGQEAPDYSSAITYKLYVPEKDATNPKLNTDPLPPGEESEFIPGTFAVRPGDHAPAGTISHDDAGLAYVKVAHATPFGTQYWYKPVPAKAA